VRRNRCYLQSQRVPKEDSGVILYAGHRLEVTLSTKGEPWTFGISRHGSVFNHESDARGSGPVSRPSCYRWLGQRSLGAWRQVLKAERKSWRKGVAKTFLKEGNQGRWDQG
jgi:hypothetical protein